MGLSSNTVTTDANGRKIFEFNARDIASMLIVFDSDAYWGFNDLSQAVTPILANNILTIDWLAFPPETRKTGKQIPIYAKRQVAGVLNCYVNFMDKYR